MPLLHRFFLAHCNTPNVMNNNHALLPVTCVMMHNTSLEITIVSKSGLKKQEYSVLQQGTICHETLTTTKFPYLLVI